MFTTISGKLTARKIVALAAAGLAAFTAPPLKAQTSTIEEIVVTARKRDESFRDVPVTINVFTENMIQQAGIQKPGDFIALVPNMTLVETQNAGNAFVVVRGVSQARNSEPSVAVLVDGVLETNPAEFNQELFDIKQIEVLKGPQGALYGKSAIGGAIIIRTKDPSDELEGAVKLGYGNGSSVRAQAGISGPMTDTIKFRASVNYYDTDGFIPSTFLGEKADPATDYSGRFRLLGKPNDNFTWDLRLSADRLETQALYFVIPRLDEANPFTSFFTPPNANDVTTPITVNNTGENNRDLWDASLKLDFNLGGGTLTSVSAWNKTREILTGDAYDFRPIPNAVFTAIYGYDLNQSQFLDLESYSQEIRFTSPTQGRFRWIAGAYYVHTDRFISTGNMQDLGNGAFPVYHDPSTNPLNPQRDAGGVLIPGTTFLADSQNNNAWAVFADATFEVTDQFEIDAALRYDEDQRENTTETPPDYLALVQDPTAVTGQVRKHTWSELQPKFTLRYKPVDNVTIYGGWSRGFRSGGFNQTGVGAVARNSVPPVLGVNDLFNAEVADTTEIGVKGQFLDRRLNAGLSIFYTQSTNGYFFVFLPANSTQNLGNLDADYKGAEFEINAHVTDHLDLYGSVGYTDSEITDMEDPAVIGNQAPLVSKTTINLGAQYRQPINEALAITVRADWNKVGETWWEPYNTTSRDPVSLVDLRIGLDADKWSVTAWSKNLTDEIYNQEFSPGGFLFRAVPRRYGVEFMYKF
ncbi:MAG TPA: TonB-dependent receptor [Steroidobacteraceae bacterium]|nr:TonB-dependent receptor [Steroidobacteraceae bacterium]